MAAPRLLLLGCKGQVGWELQRALSWLGEVVAVDFDTPAPLQADFTNPDALATLVRAVAPDLIVNAAAHTAVDKAESEAELVHTINAVAPGVLAAEAARRGAWLVHYSTDYVFDGSGDRPRHEHDEPAPLSVYGRTKLEGEHRIRASGCQHLIFRTSWVYAARGGNFMRTMLRLAAERDELKVIDDQIGAPTGAALLADITAHALSVCRNRPDLAGTYHAVAAGFTSWHGYASHVLAAARARGVTLRTPPGHVHAVPTTAFPTPARRPLNSRLSTHKLQQAFGVVPPAWQHGVDHVLTEILG